jgi:hypothetical protein
MTPFPIPPILRPENPDTPLTQVALDLTLYPERLTVEEFDAALRCYRKFAPAGTWQLYRVAQSVLWEPVPQSAMQPDVAPVSLQFLDQVRERIAAGWRTELRLWDRKTVDSWSFTCYRLPGNKDGRQFAFYRILMPLHVPPQLVLDLAGEMALGINYLSGHAGYCFLYDPAFKVSAFGEIFRLARRFWAVDVEDLNATLRAMHDGLKGVCWLTLVGPRFVREEKVRAGWKGLAGDQEIKVVHIGDGKLLVAGESPTVGDRNLRNADLQPYFRLGRLLGPILLTDCGEFPGPFAEQESTLGWIHRFDRPEGW